MTAPGIFRNRTAASMMLIALIFLSAYFLADADLGGMNTDAVLISIITRFYGVTAEEVEKAVTIPLEEAVSELSGVEELKSISEFSLSRIDLRLAASTDMERFMIELRERTDLGYAAISQFHPAVQKPQILKSGSSQQEVFIAVFSAAGLSTEELRSAAENEIKPAYSKIRELGEIEIAGGSLPEIHVTVDPEKAAAMGYSIGAAASMISGSNLYSTAGTLDSGRYRYPLFFEGRFKSPADLQRLPIGSGLRLGDIAGVDYSFREPENISRYNSRECIGLHIKSSSNSLISISHRLRKETAEWKNKGYKAEIVYDRGKELEESFMKIAGALGTGLLITTVMLLLLGVRRYRVLILFLIQPVILLFTLGILASAGFSPDRWLLAGLTVGIGMILDSALLTTENIDRTPGQLQKITKPLISSLISTLAAIFPVISVTDEIPGLLNLITAFAVLLSVSLAVSLLFIPPFYTSPASGPPGRPVLFLNRFRRMVLSFSGGLISPGCSKYRHVIIIAATLILPLAGIICIRSIPIQLSTPVDSGVIFARVELESGESLESSDSKIIDLCRILEDSEFTESVQSTSRRSGGTLAVRFDEKKVSRDEAVSRLKSLGNTVSGGFIYIPEGDRSDLMKLEISVTGPETEELKRISREALKAVLADDRALEGVLHFKTDPPAVHYIPDSKALTAAGLSVMDTASFLRWNLQGPVADKWYFSGKERDLRVMAAGNRALSVSGLGTLKIPGAASGTFSRLDQLGKFIKTTDSSRISRLNRQHSESFSAAFRKTDPVKLNTALWKTLNNVQIPPGYSFIPSSRLIERQKLFEHMRNRFILAVILIFLVLSIERNSLKHAALILLQLPFILSAPLIIVRAAGLELGTGTVFGLILVSGMGINNGILIMDNLELGIIQSVKQRFNGLFLTTATSVAGLIPMLFTGDSFFINLSIVLISGLSASLLVSIMLFPLFLIKTNVKIPVSLTGPEF